MEFQNFNGFGQVVEEDLDEPLDLRFYISIEVDGRVFNLLLMQVSDHPSAIQFELAPGT